MTRKLPPTDAVIIGLGWTGSILAEALTRAGLNVELQANDWGTLITRRASKEPIDKGGWSIFHTWTVSPDLLTPALNNNIRTTGASAWFGWPEDAEFERLRDQWLHAATPEEQKALVDQLQKRAYEVVPYIITGQFQIPSAYRKTVKGVITAPVAFLWNVEKQ